MKNWTKRGLAALLSAVLLASAALPSAYAEEESENYDDLISVTSLLPLEEKHVNVDLSDRLPMELSPMKFSELLAKEIRDAEHPDRPLTGTEKVAWAKGYSGSYTLASMDDAINLRDILGSYGTGTTLNLIVGSGKQLDRANLRYLVHITTCNLREWLIPTLYTQDDAGVRTQTPLLEYYYYSHRPTYAPTLFRGSFDINIKAQNQNDDTLYIGLALNDALSAVASRYTVKVYAGDAEEYTAGTATDITDRIWGRDMMQRDAGFPIDNYCNLVFELRDNSGNVIAYEPFHIYISYIWTNIRFPWVYNNKNKSIRSSWSTSDIKTQDGIKYQDCTLELYKEYPADREYSYRLSFYDENNDYIFPSHSNFSKLLVVKGFYKTRTEAEAAISARNAENIASSLFGTYGYKANCSGGVMFSVFYGDEPHHICITAKTGTTPEPTSVDEESLPQRPGSSDTYLEMEGADGVSLSNTYVVPYKHDTYYANGFQSILLLDESADLSALKPTFNKRVDETHIYAGDPPVSQSSGENQHDFSSGPVAYSAASENGENARNYTITYAKRQAGPWLFVNGANGPKEKDGSIRRELFLNNYFGQGHDIFLANIGDEALTGLTATLTDAQNVKLDEYWTVGGEDNDTLGAFTKVYEPSYYAGELDNIAKVRLVPDGDGEISGKLSITYGVNKDVIVFTLTGAAGDPAITTTDIPGAVKYVPYGTMIQNSNMYDWNKVTYSLYDGELPKGVELRPNGEIYGVPQETGEFPFTVYMENSVSSFPGSYADFTLKVAENTDENVEAETDKGYELTKRLPSTVTSYEAQTVTSSGDLGEFIDLWLDGKKLTLGEDYTKSQGSTIINANSQVFRNAGTGSHTLAFEFRVNGDAKLELKKAAQNFNIGGSGSSSDDSDDGDDSGSSGSSSDSSDSSSSRRPSSKPSSKPSDTAKKPLGIEPVTAPAAISFLDVATDAWYYDEVIWAAQNRLMIGLGDGLFGPEMMISQPMVSTLLARLARVDLTTASVDISDTTVEPGQWYTSAAVWAWKAGIASGSSYISQPPLSRGDMVVMLSRYLDYLAVPAPASAETPAFADAAEMTAEQLSAFQRLSAIGILKGVGDGLMAPLKPTSRAEMAIIAQRLNSYLLSQ